MDRLVPPAPAADASIPFAEISRALVIKLRHHGDVLLATPVLSALQHAAPQCEIDALVYRETAPMIADHPALARLFTIDRAWKRQGFFAQARAEASLFSELRRRRYDLIVHLCVHRRGTWLSRLLAPRWSVAPRDRGAFWRQSFTHFYPAQSHPHRHTVETNLDALRVLGYEPAPEDRRVVLVPGREAEARIEAWLAEQGLASRAFVHLHPTSRWAFKCWPAEKFAALSDRFSAQGFPLVLTAAPDAKERAMVDEILARRAVFSAPTFDLSGRLSLKELAALAARARLFVGVDSAPMHIAAAMGTPTVAIFGPSGDEEWGPWNVAHRIVASKNHPCRPCGRDGCEGSKVSECLTTLSVEEVWRACSDLLAETAP